MARTTTTFENRVLTSLRASGLQVRKVHRVYPPLDNGGDQEVLFVSFSGQAVTCYVDEFGKIIDGPFPGFGPVQPSALNRSATPPRESAGTN